MSGDCSHHGPDCVADPREGQDFDWQPPEVERLKAAILDIDAHATPLGEDDDGFITGGYTITVGSLHRALGVVGHGSVPCRVCATGASCDGLRVEAAEEYQRECLEALCDAAGIEHAGRANFYLLDDLLDHVGGEGTAAARWTAIQEAHNASCAASAPDGSGGQ